MNGLIDVQPLVVDRRLAAEIGLDEAVVLTVVAQLMREATRERTVDENGVWVRVTQQEVQELAPFWNTRTVGRILDRLISRGRLEALTPENTYDRAKWYRLGDA